MRYIFPLSHLANQLQINIEHWLHRHNEPALDPKTVVDRCSRIVVGCLQDMINHNLAYANETTHGKLAVARLLPDWDITLQDEASNEFWTDCVDDIDVIIDEWVCTYMDYGDWHLWSLTPLGPDLIVHRGEDWRIQDWERRIKTGEWTLPNMDPNLTDWGFGLADVVDNDDTTHPFLH
jgi:hypothetical protein